MERVYRFEKSFLTFDEALAFMERLNELIENWEYRPATKCCNSTWVWNADRFVHEFIRPMVIVSGVRSKENTQYVEKLARFVYGDVL